MPQSAQVTTITGATYTDTGKVRGHNEDAVYLHIDGARALAIVADGMGGALGGEEASRIAIEAIVAHTNALRDTTHPPPTNRDQALARALKSAVGAANTDIVQGARDRADLRGMGTTVTLAWLHGADLTLAHVGDSRAYRVSGDRITQLTEDHSFVQALLSAGQITEEQARRHPMSSVLYRALGQHDDVDVDLYHDTLAPHDALVLCSDGLTRHVSPAEIAKVLASVDDCAQAAHTLGALANARGGEDNITVVVLRLVALADADNRLTPPDAPANDATRPLNARPPKAADDDTLLVDEATRRRLAQRANPPSAPNA